MNKIQHKKKNKNTEILVKIYKELTKLESISSEKIDNTKYNDSVRKHIRQAQHIVFDMIVRG